MKDELLFQIEAFSRLIFFQTDEEDVFLTRLREIASQREVAARSAGSKKPRFEITVFNSTTGLHPLEDVIKDWGVKAHLDIGSSLAKDQNEVFVKIYKDKVLANNPCAYIYVITDPDRWLGDLHIQRRILNCVQSMNQTNEYRKTIIFVGPRRIIPEKLSRYMEVVVDKGLSDEKLREAIQVPCDGLKITPPEDMSAYRGLTSWEAVSATIQSIRRVRLATGTPAVDLGHVRDYRRRVLRKTDLLTPVDTSDVSFEKVGGVDRFKNWVKETKGCWTPEGQAYGLTPPKGVLVLGVWGCGKSLSVKAMGQEWGIPVVSLEMGKLRTMAQGGSEANVYTVLSLIEKMAPAIVFVDEAEKSFSGSASSAMTDGGTTNRMLGIFSTWLQETKVPVTLALTANTLATLPVEFVNRMDERFFFDLPTNRDRIEILKIHLTKLKRDPRKYDLAMLAQKADRLVGREIEQAVKSALRASFAKNKPTLDQGLLAAELETRPRILNTMADDINSLVSWVGFDQNANDGVRARYASTPAKLVEDSPIRVVE